MIFELLVVLYTTIVLYLSVINYKYYKIKNIIEKIKSNYTSEIIMICDINDNEFSFNTILTYFKNKIKQYYLKDYIIDINDANTFRNLIKNTNYNIIDLILETYGGYVSDNDMIMDIMETFKNINKKNKFRGHIINYAKSCGTMLALSCNEIYMNDYAYMSPTDPIIDYNENSYSAKHIIDSYQNIKCEDNTFGVVYYEAKMFYDVNIKDVVNKLNKLSLKKRINNNFKKILTDGIVPHHYPINKSLLKTHIKIYDQMEDINTVYKLLID